MTQFSAGSLKRNIGEGSKIGASNAVLQWIKNGVIYHFYQSLVVMNTKLILLMSNKPCLLTEN